MGAEDRPVRRRNGQKLAAMDGLDGLNERIRFRGIMRDVLGRVFRPGDEQGIPRKHKRLAQNGNVLGPVFLFAFAWKALSVKTVERKGVSDRSPAKASIDADVPAGVVVIAAAVAVNARAVRYEQSSDRYLLRLLVPSTPATPHGRSVLPVRAMPPIVVEETDGTPEVSDPGFF